MTKTKLVMSGLVRPLIEPRLPDWIEPHFFMSKEEALALAPQAEIGWFDMYDKRAMAAAIAAASELRWLNSLIAGMDGLPLEDLRARHVILGSISPFFLEDDDEPERWMISYRSGNAATPADVLVGALEDEQMHRRATAVRDFYHHSRYVSVPAAEHELWHPNYLQAIKSALDRLGAERSPSAGTSSNPTT